MRYNRIELSVNAEIFEPEKSIEDYEEWFRPYVSRIHHDGEIYRYKDLHGNFTVLHPGDYFVENTFKNDPFVVRKQVFLSEYEKSNTSDLSIYVFMLVAFCFFLLLPFSFWTRLSVCLLVFSLVWCLSRAGSKADKIPPSND